MTTFLATATTTTNANATALALAIQQNENIPIRRYWNPRLAMLADLWGLVNIVIVPNGDDCNADIGNGSGSIKGGGGGDDSVVPLPTPPPLVILVVIVIFDATSLLPAMAPIDHWILPPLGGNTRRRNGYTAEEYLQWRAAAPQMSALVAAAAVGMAAAAIPNEE